MKICLRHTLVLIFLLCPPAVDPRATAQEAPAKSVAEQPVRDKDGYLEVSFRYLSNFPYRLPTDEEFLSRNFADQLPAHIKELHGEKVAVDGFLLPIEMEEKKLKKLIVFRTYLACCFGSIPRMNEWVYVTLKKPKKVSFQHGMIVKVYGTLEVGEQIDADGGAEDGGLSLYRIRADKIRASTRNRKWWQFWKKNYRHAPAQGL